MFIVSKLKYFKVLLSYFNGIIKLKSHYIYTTEENETHLVIIVIIMTFIEVVAVLKVVAIASLEVAQQRDVLIVVIVV